MKSSGWWYSFVGWQINHYDLSARYAGVLVSITSAFGTIGGILSPIVAGQLTNSREIDGWANVFYITIALLLSSSIFYLIFASGEEQPWSKPPKDIQLIQKADPLARRPYKSVLQQPMHSDKSDKSDDGEKPDYGATRDVNDDIINKAVHRLSRKLDEDDNQ